jgi:Nif-specific regulatory protein
MTSGPRPGIHFLLDAARENLIGRGRECAIVLSDPICSRIHAVIAQQDHVWRVRDSSSLNGTEVNGEAVTEAVLDEGHTLRVGSTVFSFHMAEQPPTAEDHPEVPGAPTIIKNLPVDGYETGSLSWSTLSQLEQIQQLLLLYQLSIKLLGCDDPDTIIHIVLDLVRERTEAAVAGFLWVSDDGCLKPRWVIPQEAREQVTLSPMLTELVCRQAHAVWIANHAESKHAELNHYTDALCVPLASHRGTRGVETLGALHVYRHSGNFRQADFELTISIANIAAVALVRARSHLSLRSEYERLASNSPGYDELVGNSPPMIELKSRITRVARASGCVLIRGESGTGKELVARAVHRASARADRPMLSVNCAAIPADLMESHLFGHKAGAFTSADRDHLGLFQQADLGTLFLDEVGELTLAGQAKLLRIVEGHPFLPVGATEQIHVDVRVLCATNQDLRDYVRQRRFREDLYYRLSVFELAVPPLRQRGSDLMQLIEYFLAHFRQHHGRPDLRISQSALDKLLVYPWPGNVRQLRNVIDSAVVLAEGDAIQTADLGLQEPRDDEPTSLRLDEWEQRLMGQALSRAGGNVPEAARLLGIGRATLYRKIEQYQIAK